MSEVKSMAHYKHYKGGIYYVLAVGVHTETGEGLVVYREAGNADNQVWIRPLDMFTEIVDGKPRFERV